MIANQAQGPVQMRAGLLVDQDMVGAGLDEAGSVSVGIGDHQVNFELEPGDLPDGLNHRDADADVGDKVSIHYIHMEDGSPCTLDTCDAVAQAGEVSRKNRRKDFYHCPNPAM